MKKNMLLLILLPLFLFANEKVYLLKVNGVIDNGIAPYIERGIKEANTNQAKYVILEINTFGGRVDAATEIKDIILNSAIPTVAFINKRAISAGSLIALSCQKIVMMEGSSIGATTVVDQKGNKMSEKAQSYMRAEMSATAEKNGRRTDIVKAMVDEDIKIVDTDADGDSIVVSKKGKLLTLTSKEALKYGICDTIVNSKSNLYLFLGVNNPDEVSVNISISENIVRFLTNPIVSSLLLTLGILGLIFEMKTAGWGVGGTVGLLVLSLFFGSRYVINLADYIDIILFLVGLILLALEIFVIPGFGVAGVLGILAIILSFFLSFIGNYPSSADFISAGAVVSASFIMSLIGIYLMFRYIPKTKFLNFLVVRNQEKSSSAIKSNTDYNALMDKKGIAVTDLRLSGNAQIEGVTYQVMANTEYISKDEKISVCKVEGNTVFVDKVV